MSAIDKYIDAVQSGENLPYKEGGFTKCFIFEQDKKVLLWRPMNPSIWDEWFKEICYEIDVNGKNIARPFEYKMDEKCPIKRKNEMEILCQMGYELQEMAEGKELLHFCHEKWGGYNKINIFENDISNEKERKLAQYGADVGKYIQYIRDVNEHANIDRFSGHYCGLSQHKKLFLDCWKYANFFFDEHEYTFIDLVYKSAIKPFSVVNYVKRLTELILPDMPAIKLSGNTGLKRCDILPDTVVNEIIEIRKAVMKKILLGPAGSYISQANAETIRNQRIQRKGSHIVRI